LEFSSLTEPVKKLKWEKVDVISGNSFPETNGIHLAVAEDLPDPRVDRSQTGLVDLIVLAHGAVPPELALFVEINISVLRPKHKHLYDRQRSQLSPASLSSDPT
jgi:hypothetical protein